MKKTLLLVFLLLPFALYAGHKQGRDRLDSLLGANATATAIDTNRVKLLVAIGMDYYYFSPDTGIDYGHKALKMAEDLQWEKGITKAYVAIGMDEEVKSNFSVALDYYYKALKIHEKNGDKNGIAYSCWGIGNILNEQKNYNKSLEYDLRALKIYELIDFKKGTSSLYGNIANNYLSLGKKDKALEYYFKALKIKESLGDTRTIAIQLLDIGNVYFLESNYSLAMAYYFRAKNTVGTEQAKTIYARVAGNIGANYVKLAMDSTHVIVPDSLILAGKTANLEKGIEYLRESVVMSREIQDIESLQNSYSDLAEALEYRGDYKDALESYKQHILFKDSIFSQESSLKIATLNSQRDLEMKDKDIKIEKLKSTIFIVGIVFLLIIVAVGILKLRSQIRHNRTLASEKQAHLEHIEVQDNTLKDIAYIQSHYVRGPVTTILGLSQLFNYDNPEDPQNKELMAGIASAAEKLDETVTAVVNKENSIKKRGKAPRK